MLDQGIKDQLKTHFATLSSSLTLALYRSKSPKQDELRELLGRGRLVQRQDRADRGRRRSRRRSVRYPSRRTRHRHPLSRRSRRARIHVAHHCPAQQRRQRQAARRRHPAPGEGAQGSRPSAHLRFAQLHELPRRGAGAQPDGAHARGFPTRDDRRRAGRGRHPGPRHPGRARRGKRQRHRTRGPGQLRRTAGDAGRRARARIFRRRGATATEELRRGGAGRRPSGQLGGHLQRAQGAQDRSRGPATGRPGARNGRHRKPDFSALHRGPAPSRGFREAPAHLRHRCAGQPQGRADPRPRQAKGTAPARRRGFATPTP